MSDLVERLRGTWSWPPSEVMAEAADRIEQLEAERDEAKQCWMQVSEDWRGACDRIEQLEAALREAGCDHCRHWFDRAALGEERT